MVINNYLYGLCIKRINFKGDFDCPVFFINFITVCILLFGYVGNSFALSFTIKSGQHPRVLIDQARVSKIQDDALTDLPLYYSNFPQTKGTITFDIDPVVRTDTNQSYYLPVFDRYQVGRNHIFLRHYDEVNPNTNLTYCGTDPLDTTVLCMQLAMQPGTGQYIASKNFSMNTSQWQTLRLSWDSNAHIAIFQLANNAPINLVWRKDGNGIPIDWVADGQRFSFTGRDRIDNVKVYDSEDPLTGQLLADFPMNAGMGISVTDVSGNNQTAEINAGVVWGTRTAGGSDGVIELDGYTGEFSPVSNSVLYYAWQDFYSNANNEASKIISGTSSIDVSINHPNAIISVARKLGLGYLVTGEINFLTAALLYADQLIAVTPASTGGDYTQAGRIEAMGILYDWFYSDIITTTHAASSLSYGEAMVGAIKNTLMEQDRFICGSNNSLTASWSCNTLPASPGELGGHSHQNNTETVAALLAIIDEHPELEPLLEIEYENFVNLYNPLREWVSVDGGHHMGWAYGSTYTFLDSIQLFNMATTDIDMLAPWQGKLIDRYIYGLRGDQLFPVSGDYFNFKPDNEQLVEEALWASQYFGNTVAENFYNRIIKPAKKGSRISELLYWQSGLGETAIESLNLSRHFQNSGQVVMRDTWDYVEATLLEFKSTSFSSVNHHHFDQNAFTLFYKSPLLIDSGSYDKYATEHWYNYYTRTIAHNTLTVFDPDESWVKFPSVFCCTNDGGQEFKASPDPTLAQILSGGSHHLDGIQAYEYTGDYTYTRGNASKAYSSAKLDQSNGFQRDMVFLRATNYWAKPITIIFDKVVSAAGKGSLKKRVLFHTVNEPEPLGGLQLAPGHFKIIGNIVTVRNGSGMLFSQTVLPENPVITKIGGQNGGDYRFLVPVDTGGGNYQLTNFPPSPDPGSSKPEMGEWRFEIGAAIPTEREYFLTVLSVADNVPTQQPIVVTNLSSATTAVVLLENSQIVAFNKQDDSGATLQWDMPGLDVAMLVIGLMPNVNYSLTVSNFSVIANGFHVTVCLDTNGTELASNAGTLNLASPISITPDLDGDMTGDACDEDIDGDGLSNAAEQIQNTDPYNPDTDGDLLNDGDEVNVYITNPLDSDSDNDGFRDGTEVNNGSLPLDAGSTPNLTANGDANLDGILNAADILLVQRYVLGLAVLTAEQIAYADLYPVQADGVLTVSDLILVTKQVFEN